MNKLVIIGAGGQGKVAADVASKAGYNEIVFLDDDPSAKECLGFCVAGTSEKTDNYKDWDFFVAIGNAKTREKIQNRLSANGYSIATLIHPFTSIGKNVKIGKGTIVMAGAVINTDAVIGNGCVINTSASVDHDCTVADYAHVSVGSHLAGTVSVGKYTWIGIGASVSNNLSICQDCLIGAGAVVVKDIKEAGTYVGVPVKKKD